MSDCCSPKGYRWIFSEKNARSDAQSYRRKGLDLTSRRIVDYLKAGVTRAISVELTPTYEQVALELLREAGFEDRVERKVTDFAQSAGEFAVADIVIMNRVICCYPDMPVLAGAAADHAGEVLVMSFPRRTWWTRAMLALGNLALRMTRRQFQVFIHPPAQILAEAERHGLHKAIDTPGLFWEVAAAQRAV